MDSLVYETMRRMSAVPEFQFGLSRQLILLLEIGLLNPAGSLQHDACAPRIRMDPATYHPPTVSPPACVRRRVRSRVRIPHFEFEGRRLRHIVTRNLTPERRTTTKQFSRGPMDGRSTDCPWCSHPAAFVSVVELLAHPELLCRCSDTEIGANRERSQDTPEK